jgi:hypothetical protein
MILDVSKARGIVYPVTQRNIRDDLSISQNMCLICIHYVTRVTKLNRVNTHPPKLFSLLILVLSTVK